MREIPIRSLEFIKIGQAEDTAAATGCTVFICENGMRAGLDVRGGGPASRESQLLNPLAAAQTIHAIVLAGGSAFGLGAANGVMKCLEERGIGFDVGVTKVPLVAQSDLFDLTVGDPMVRPDAAMGYSAAALALNTPNFRDGNFGAGCGATVGKITGMARCMKTGIGSFALQIGELMVGAVVALNALGDVFDASTGQQVAGLLTEDRTALCSTVKYMSERIQVVENRYADSSHDASGQADGADTAAGNSGSGAAAAKNIAVPVVSNTTLAVVMTNARFDKAQLCKIAGMAHDGYARSIRPVHTSADGDSIYAVSGGEVSADQDLVGTLAAEVVSRAILKAVKSADSAYGYPAYKDLPFSKS